MDRQTREAIDRLAEEIGRIDRRTRTQGRAHRVPQLAHSSLEEGQSLEVRGPGGTRSRIGWLPDGTVGMVTEGGDPVSAPTAPTVTPSLGGLRITWDGQLSGDLALPGDFDHMAVHVSTTAGFEPSAATHVGTIRRAGEGGMLPVVPLPYVEHYVVLVPVTTGGITGDPSVEVSGTPLQSGAADLQAGSVEAVHISAGAVTAAKLEAILVLVSRIVAGEPAAARVELDTGGIRGYDDAGALVFAVDSSGNAVFSGDITASDITGSRMVLGDPEGSGNYGVIQEFSPSLIHNQVVSASTAHAQLAALDTQAEFSAWGSDAADAPVGGMTADPANVELLLYSDSGAGAAAPFAALTAQSQQAQGIWQSPTGSRIRVVADADYTALFSAPPGSATEPAATTDAAVYGFRASGDEVPALTLQSPIVDTGPGANLRSVLHLMATTSTRDYGRAEMYARRVVIGNDLDVSAGGAPTSEPGVLFLRPTHSIDAERHAPKTTVLQNQPTGGGSGGDWIDFTEGEFPALPFQTSWSGRTKVTIQHTGINADTPGATLSTGFRLSGGWTLPADPTRSAMTRAAEPRGGSTNVYSFQQQQVFFLELPGNVDIVLTPAWRTSSTPTWGTTVLYDFFYNTSITVEPQL